MASPAYQILQAKVVALEDLAVSHALGLSATSLLAKQLQALTVSVSASLAGASADANTLSARAALAAATLENAVVPAPKKGKPIQPKQLGGGAHLDAAVGQLDAAVTNAGTMVDDSYAYLTALDTRAAQSQLPAGNASGATVQVGALVYSLPGADRSTQQLHYAGLVGAFAIVFGSTIGLALYRVQHGQGSSLFPAKG